MGKTTLTLLFLCGLAVIFPVLKANVVEDYDDFWQKQEEEAKEAAILAYNPNPDEVVHHLNHHVHL